MENSKVSDCGFKVFGTTLTIHPSTYAAGPYRIDSFRPEIDKEPIILAVANVSLQQILELVAGREPGRIIKGKKIDPNAAHIALVRESNPQVERNLVIAALLWATRNDISQRQIFNKALETGEDYELELPDDFVPIHISGELAHTDNDRMLYVEKANIGSVNQWIVSHYQCLEQKAPQVPPQEEKGAPREEIVEPKEQQIDDSERASQRASTSEESPESPKEKQLSVRALCLALSGIGLVGGLFYAGHSLNAWTQRAVPTA